MDFDTPDPQQPYQPPYQQSHWQQGVVPGQPMPPQPQQPMPAPAPQPMQPPAPLYTPPAPQFQPPQPPQPAPQLSQEVPQSALRPVPVVRVLSPVGLEYVFLTILLFISAGSLMGALLLLVDGQTSFAALAFPAAALLVSVPLFAVLFLRLKNMELRMPELRFDPSKRRSTQFTQIVAFLFCLSALIGLVFSIFAKIGGSGGPALWKYLLNALCVLGVAGGVLVYYWYDEHKTRR